MNKDEIMNRRIKEYLEKNMGYYDLFEQRYLKGLDMNYIRKYKHDMPDIFRQILEEIGYFDDCPELSGYKAFIDLLDNEFGLERNITEIAGGAIPTLAHKISLRQKKGTITVYDPRLTTYYDETERFILKREKFTRNTNVEGTDMLIGFMPCEATQAIIENATANNKDFMIALCEGGPHGDEYDFYEDAEEWLGAMLYLAERGMEKHDMGELKVIDFNRYNSPYPLIYNKRKQ